MLPAARDDAARVERARPLVAGRPEARREREHVTDRRDVRFTRQRLVVDEVEPFVLLDEVERRAGRLRRAGDAGDAQCGRSRERGCRSQLQFQDDPSRSWLNETRRILAGIRARSINLTTDS